MEQALVFRVGGEFYGLEIEKIQEVVESPVFHYIPKAPQTFRGAINFHGSIIPVIDLPAYLGETQVDRDQRVIVLLPSLGRIALTASEIHRVVPMERESLMPVNEDTDAERFIRAVFSHNDMMINVLDIVRLLDDLQHF